MPAAVVLAAAVIAAAVPVDERRVDRTVERHM